MVDDPGDLIIHNPDSRISSEAALVWDTTLNNTIAIQQMLARLFPDAGTQQLAEKARYSARRIRAGDLTRAQDTLASQMEVLQAGFAELMRQGALKLPTNSYEAVTLIDCAKGLQGCYTNSLNVLRKTTFRPKRDLRERARGNPSETEDNG